MNYVESRRAGVPVRTWTNGVVVDHKAMDQLHNVALLPIIHSHVAAMPDVHWGIGATVGSVIPTRGAIIPAAVGVDIGCGMMATRLDGVTADDLPDSLVSIREAIERVIPLGRGALYERNFVTNPPSDHSTMVQWIKDKHPEVTRRRKLSSGALILSQFGTLGGGNHFIELCLDENEDVWMMLHSGSRGIGNCIGNYFIKLAKADMRRHISNLPDSNLAYFTEGSEHFQDYVYAVMWAQRYADGNRRVMMDRILRTLKSHLPPFKTRTEAIACHHNYVASETHFGENVFVTRKGAVRAGVGEMGIIPGSMGAKSYIVRGKGNAMSFESCSHGAGRVMSRSEAKRTITLEDHIKATEGVECKKDRSVLDESPACYKDIQAVMDAQSDLVEIVHTLKQVVCVKG